MNRVGDRVSIEKNDANIYMYMLSHRGVKPHLIDIDPFGSPIPFIDSALELVANHGVIAVTATDTAPLSGTHLHALRRKYDVLPGRTSWEKEQALRILIGYLIRRAAAKDIALHVLLAYYADHYVRAYLRVTRGAKRANKSLATLAYANWCPTCGYVEYSEKPIPRCNYCHSRTISIGPVYSGPLCDKDLLGILAKEAEKATWLTEYARAKQLLELLSRECDIVKPYYRIDKLCSYLKTNMPKINRLVKTLEQKGYSATRTHFDPRAIKTSAPHQIVLNTIIELSKASRKN